MSTKPLPKHPARRLAFTWTGMGVGFVLAAAWLATGPGLATIVGMLGAFGLYFFRQGLTVWQRLPAVQYVNLGAQHLTRGAFDEVRAEHAKVSPAARRDTMIGRAVLLQQALVALYEGHLAEAETLATQELAMRRSWAARPYERTYDAAALGARALARAARGDAAGATADADAAEAFTDASPDVIARARLVKALVLSRAPNQEDALRQCLIENAPIVLEYGMPRERMLFRALRRMSRGRARSVYREPAAMKDDRAPSRTQSWIAAIAPEAASYTSGDRMLADIVEEPPPESASPGDVSALERLRKAASNARRPKTGRKVLALWGLLILMFVTIWQFLAPADTHHHAASAAPVVVAPSLVSALGQGALGVAIVAALLALILYRAQRFLGRQAEAKRLVTLGDFSRGVPALQKLAASKAHTTSAQAHLDLARLASRSGDFGAAAKHTDAGIALVSSGQARILSVDLLLPSLMMESAVAMAALGGEDEAAAELALLERDFPTFSQLAFAQLRIRFMIAVRTGDRARARQLAKARTAEMRIPYREDMLADLVLASHGDLDEQDRERVDAELADDPSLRTWIDSVAPGLRSERPQMRVATATAAPPLEQVEEEEPEDVVPPVAMRARDF